MSLLQKFQSALWLSRTGLVMKQPQNFHTQSTPLFVKLTERLLGEPMKKKKKIDPGLIIQKEIKKQRKLEKEIRRLESKGRILKPIEEYEPNKNVLNTLRLRHRKETKLSDEEMDRRAHLMNKWSRFKAQQYDSQDRKITKCVNEMNKALQELKKENIELYHLALSPDESLLPWKHKGPSLTPPIQNYLPSDGEFVDITRKFDK